MLVVPRGLTGDRRTFRRSEVAVEEASDQPGGDAHIYALTDEAAYLQTDDDEKPAVIAAPTPDLAQFKCWFCRKSYQQVENLFGAEYPVRDPHDFGNETLIFICNECVTRFAESLAQERPKAPRTP
jgi:ClpX C4-type zinc finger